MILGRNEVDVRPGKVIPVAISGGWCCDLKWTYKTDEDCRDVYNQGRLFFSARKPVPLGYNMTFSDTVLGSADPSMPMLCVGQRLAR